MNQSIKLTGSLGSHGVDSIYGGTTPRSLVDFQPSEATKIRVADLIQLEKTDGLTAVKKAELDHYLQLEHLLRMAKARARRHLHS